jgi:hypothetical protein
MQKTILTLALLAAVPLGAQQPQGVDKDPTRKVTGSGALPAGWQMRFDTPRPGRPEPKPEDVKFVPMGGGFHATSGPAAIYYNPKDKGQGTFMATGSFAQSKPSGHEAYGVFVGGRALQSPEQEYLYLVIRPMDGGFYIAHRKAAEVHAISPWSPSPAVNKQDDTGKASNKVAIQVAADSVHFLVNGQRVKSFAKSEMHGFETDGQAGLRINHNLDVHIGSFEVKK